MPEPDRSFADPDSLLLKPSDELVHAVDDERCVRVTGPLHGNVEQDVAFTGGFAVVDEMDAQAGRMHQAECRDFRCILVRIGDKAQLGVETLRDLKIGDADADMGSAPAEGEMTL